MPYCEYQCQECGDHFEVMLSYEEVEEDPAQHCPQCGGEAVDRLAAVTTAHGQEASWAV